MVLYRFVSIHVNQTEYLISYTEFIRALLLYEVHGQKYSKKTIEALNNNNIQVSGPKLMTEIFY